MLFNRFTHSFRLLFLALFALTIAACGSGDGETPVSDTPLTGRLLDGPVSGVTFSSGTQSGTTNAAGEFEYLPGDIIVFSIGGIKLGQVTLTQPASGAASLIVTPVEITGSADASDPRVIRILQLLQSLDSDGDHSNGITITLATLSAAASFVIDFSDPDFDSNNPSFDLQTFVDGVADPDDPVPTIVSANQALQNFITTIEGNNLNISIGSGGTGGGTASGGSVPDATILRADGAAADLTTGFTGFDSGTGALVVASDSSYGNALEVTVADGYAPGALNLAQLFITGLSSLDAYGEFLFKVKGLTDNNLVLKIEPPGGPDVAINLATPGAGIVVTALGDGWSQVVVDLAQFGDLAPANVVIMQTLDNAYALGDTFLLTDIGFNNAGPVTATGGSVPDATILRADGAAADLTTGFTGFDSQTGTAIVSTDSSYGNALQVTVADGYAPGALNLAQLFITGLSSLDAYGEFLFKVKGLTDNNLVLKIEPPGGPDVAINLASPGAGITVTDLGDGWSQVVVDLAQFGDLAPANVVIMQTLDNAYALGDTFLLTDIGFNNAGPVTATGGSVPDATILRADGAAADLTTGFTGFDSGTGALVVASDSSYGNALEVTVADGYAPGALNLAQLFITGLSSLDAYGEFLFKVKGLTDNNLVLKIEPPGGPDVAINLASPGAGITVTDLGDGWSQVVVDLAQFGDLAPANVVIMQTLDNAYALGDTFLLTDIGFNNAGAGGGGGGGGAGAGGTPGTFENGDFESGDLTGWTQSTDGGTSSTPGTISIAAPPGGQAGTAVARLQASGSAAGSQDVIISQVALGAGVVAQGDTINVTFDLYGTLTGAGGVVFAELIYPDINGNDVGNRNFIDTNTPYFPNLTWTTYSGSKAAGLKADGSQASVAGGVTLAIKASCGPIPDGCGVDAYIDNVTYTVTPAVP